MQINCKDMTAARCGSEATVRMELAVRERLLRALRDCACAVEAVGREPPPRTRTRPLAPALEQERRTLLASFARALHLVEAAPVVPASSSGEEDAMKLSEDGGGARPKKSVDRRSKTPLPASTSGPDSRTLRTKSAGDMHSATARAPASATTRPGATRDALPKLRHARPREMGSHSPPVQPTMKITINKKNTGSSSSNRTEEDEIENERNKQQGSSDSESECSSVPLNYTNNCISVSESDVRMDSSEDSATITASSSESSLTSSGNQYRISPCRSKTTKGRDAKKSVSFFMNTLEKREMSPLKKYQGCNGTARISMSARRNSESAFVKQPRCDSIPSLRLKSARNTESDCPNKSAQDSSIDCVKTLRKGSASYKLGRKDYEKPLSRELKKVKMGVIAPKKMCREITKPQVQKASTSELLPTETSTTKRGDKSSKALKYNSVNQ